MEKDGAALLLLLFVLVLAMLGAVLFVTGSSRRAALAERGRGANDDAAVKRLRQSFDAWLRRRPSGRKLGNWLQGAGSPLSPADLLLLCVSGTMFLTVVAVAVHAARRLVPVRRARRRR